VITLQELKTSLGKTVLVITVMTTATLLGVMITEDRENVDSFFILVNRPALHNKPHIRNCRDIGERIPADGDQTGKLAGGY
jgi:hypothetical protein